MSLLLFLLATVAFTVESIAGFGSALLIITFGLQLLDQHTLLAAILPVGMLLNSAMLARGWHDLAGAYLKREVLPYMGLGFLMGSIIAWLGGESAWLLRLYACFVLFLGVNGLRPRAADAPAPLIWQSRVLLGLGGVIHGIFATGGPLVVWASERRLSTAAALRASLSVVWFVAGIALLIQYALRGMFTEETLRISLGVVPAVVVGLWLGGKLQQQLPAQTFRRLVYVLLVFGGISLLLRA